MRKYKIISMIIAAFLAMSVTAVPAWAEEAAVIFEDNSAVIGSAALRSGFKSYAYTGKPITLDPANIIVKTKSGAYVSSENYEIEYINNVEKGTGSAIIRARSGSGYYGSKVLTFKIKANGQWKGGTTSSGANGKVLVAYFSATGTTKAVAEKMAKAAGGDLFEIVPAVPYTADDLNYSNSGCRAAKEQNDSTARPEISGNVSNIDSYDTVIIGYPIWFGKEPRIIDTFVESCGKLAGKTVVNFCTSGSTGISGSTSSLKALTPEAAWIEGQRFASSVSQADVDAWVASIGIKKEETTVDSGTFIIEANGKTLTAAFTDNSSATAFKELLGKGPVTVDMHDYGNFEKVGGLGTTLPTNDTSITTTPGDVILYQGSNITIYYDKNTWSFTKLGHVEGATKESMKSFLGSGDVTVTFRLP